MYLGAKFQTVYEVYITYDGLWTWGIWCYDLWGIFICEQGQVRTLEK